MQLSTIVAFILLPMINSEKLPKKWNPDFSITLSHSGSMRGGSTEVKFTFETCSYQQISYDGKSETFSFKMTDKYRLEILEKMHALGVADIKTDGQLLPVNDGWFRSICFDTYCIEGGPSRDLSTDDRNRFTDAYNYLQNFAMEKRP